MDVPNYLESYLPMKAVEKSVDVASFEDVFEREENPLLRFAYTFTKNREQAEDFVQEAFLRLHQHWAEVEQPRAWLYRTVRNMAINWLKKSQREVHLEAWHEWGEMVEEQPNEAFESLSLLQVAVNALPEGERQLVELKYRENLRYAEIAAKTGLSASNVGYKLHHILKNLADTLRRVGVERA